MQGSSGDEDTENRLVDTVREGESGTNGESSINIYTLSHIRQIKALVTQSYLTLCDPMDCSPPGSSVLGILQARILEWVTMPSFKGSSQTRDPTHVSADGLFTTSTNWEAHGREYQ